MLDTTDIYTQKGDVRENPEYGTAHNDILLAESRFINLSSYTIVIAFRDGSIATLPTRKLVSYNESFVIGHKKINRSGTIQTVDGPECKNTERVRKELLKNNNQSFYWEECITIETIMSHRSGIYIPSADIVVSVATMYDTMASHPYSIQSIHNGYVRVGDAFDSRTDIGVIIRAIDNTAECGKLYVIFNNDIAVVIPRKSVVLDSGIYVTGLPSLNTTTTNTIRRDVRYDIIDSLSGKAPFKFYLTLLEAKEALRESQNIVLQDSIDAREHELAIARIKQQKDIYEQELIRLKLELSEKKVITDEIEASRLREETERKHRYDAECDRLKSEAAQSANSQKTLVEGLKLLSVVVTVGWSLYKILK